MQVHVARQPIFDVHRRVWAYELLFREGPDNVFRSNDPDMASRTGVENTFTVFGLDSLTDGKRAFINFTGNLIEKGIPLLLNRNTVAIEIFESAEPSDELVSACLRLKGLGYMLALDDFVPGSRHEALVSLVDVIKVDFMSLSHEQIADMVGREDLRHVKFLAEKVETHEDLRRAMDLGFAYFQGYFFSRPIVTSAKAIPVSKLNWIQLLKEVNMPEPDYMRITDIVSRDVALSYRVLKIANSAAFSLRSEVKSIKHALVIMGLQEIRRWLSVIAMSGMAHDKTEELLTASIVRAQFAGAIAPHAGHKHHSDQLFMAGLFSMLDAILDRPMEAVVSDLPVPPEIKSALMGGPSPFDDVLALVKAYEKAQWDEVQSHMDRLGLSDKCVSAAYLAALKWARQVMGLAA